MEIVEKKNIAAKLVQVAKACGYIQKDADNKEQKYKYTSAAAVMQKVNPALVEHRLVSIPEFSIVSEKEKTTFRGGVWQIITVQLNLHIIDADSNESLVVTSLGTGTDPGDKAVAKAQTMALKYAWLTALNIETGDEPEADSRTDQVEFTTRQTGFVPPPGLPNNSRVQAISYLWQSLGWDTGALSYYLEQRFNKPVDQITDTELSVVANEANSYLQQMR